MHSGDIWTWFDRHRMPVDALFVAMMAPLLLLPDYSGSTMWLSGPLRLVEAGMLLALVWRRTRPEISAGVVYAGALVLQVFGLWVAVPAHLLVLVSLYSVTAYGRPWAGRLAFVLTLAGVTLFVVGSALDEAEAGPFVIGGMALVMVAMAAATWSFALLRRSRLDRVTYLAERAERLEVERDQQARIAAAAERARIAREMHDIVAHSLSVMIAQADGGRYAAEQDPAAARRALGTISETGRAALADMRRLLGVLRTEDSGSETGPRTPMPNQGDLDDLVRTVRAVGMEVSLVRVGAPRPLPPGMELAVHRICQESLTNVMKHGGPGARTTIVQQWHPACLSVQVEDDGRGAAAAGDGAGQGLIGMRERAEMFGGTLLAGPRPGGGFRIHLELPIPGPAGPSAPPEGTP